MGSTCSAESASATQEMVIPQAQVSVSGPPFAKGKGSPHALPPVSLQQASAQLGARLEELDMKVSQADEEAKQWVAKQATYPAAKSRAMQALKKKKLYEQQRDQLMGTQFNVETLAFQQSQASVALTAVSAMQEAAATLKKQTDSIGVNEVENLRDNLEYLQTDMQDIQAALSTPVAGIDDIEAEKELQAIYAEQANEDANMVQQILAGNGSVSGQKTKQSVRQRAAAAA